MSRATIVATGLTLALAAAGCSPGWWSSGRDGRDAEVGAGSPCTQACCCKTRDSYYVRYSCTGAGECAADGGECLEAAIGKCAQ